MEEIHGLVEVSDTLGSDRRRELVRQAYRASAERCMPIGLVLKNVDPAEVNGVLDPLVEEYGPRGPRVYFLDYGSTPDLLQMARRSRFVVAASEEFRERLSRENIRFHEPAASLALAAGPEQGAA